MSSTFYNAGNHRFVAGAVAEYLNSAPDFLTAETAQSPRATGDAIEKLVSEGCENILGEWCADYSSGFSRRAMADFAFTDRDGCCSKVDVKTHNRNTEFNRPNLTSVRRLIEFYQSDSHYFALLIVKYDVEGIKCRVTEVIYEPIEYLDWNCLAIGALGWGQIQIVNANDIVVNREYPRREWMLELCRRMLQFYPNEKNKIEDRIKYADNARQYWESR